MKEFILEHFHFKKTAKHPYKLAILPWGATEAHNYHLPYGTDNFETMSIAEESVRLANSKGAEAVLLPGIPYGVNTGQKGIPLTINMNPSTQMMVLRDIIESVENSGIFKFLLMNGHGGNDFKQMLRELGAEFPDMMLASCNWFQAVDKSEIFTNKGDHADEMETSLMMFIQPELVLPVDRAGKGESKQFRVKALNESWTWMERKWTEVTKDTGIGDPSEATREKGEQFFRIVCEKIAGLICELNDSKKDSFYL